MRIEEFDPEKSWWNDRKESAQAWRVPVQQIIDSGFNLDIKNPIVSEEVEILSFEQLIKQLHESNKEIDSLLSEIKDIMMSK